ncbi:MAG: GGDEF domain-containing protein [Nocardioidaceae bacterium]
MFLDLDRFKLVNDSYGHLVGDELLVQVAARLRAGLEPANSLARMSGDEFIVLIEDVHDISDVTTVAERLLLVLQEPFAVEGHHIFMSASIGVGLTQLDFRRDEMLAASMQRRTPQRQPAATATPSPPTSPLTRHAPVWISRSACETASTRMSSSCTTNQS